MCGLAGAVDVEGRAIAHDEIIRMANAIAHRGPDADGYMSINPTARTFRPYDLADWRQAQNESGNWAAIDSIALAHRRFAIIDLSSNGNQPFVGNDRDCVITYNGEIYNYLELRTELEAQGVRFRTTSDTEVLVEAYRQWGTDCFSRLNGFWALAIFDSRTQKLILSRDRLGKKPLYWTRQGSRIYFASEIKALLAVDSIWKARRPNERAIFKWLRHHLKNDDSETFFEGIYAFPAAHWAEVTADFPSTAVRYWTIDGRRMKAADITPDEAALQVRTLLRDSVALRMRADVPISVELSGGIDSSVLTALAAEVSRSPIQTETVSVPGGALDETPYANSVARKFGTVHRVHEASEMHFWSACRDFTWLHEEPYHSPNLFSNQIIWAAMRQGGTKVSLNGAAGDELFCGYGIYFTPAIVDQVMSGEIGVAAKNVWAWSEPATHAAALWRFGTELAGNSAKRLAPRFIAQMRTPRHVGALDFVAKRKTPMQYSKRTVNDIVTDVIPYWMCSGDKNYMGIPLEVRAPFLDYRVVELATRLPVSYLIRDGWHKWILRKAFSDLLPPDVLWRRQKVGFPIDMNRFSRTSAGVYALIVEASADNPFVGNLTPEILAQDWGLVSFLLWYERFFGDSEALFDRISRLASETPEQDAFPMAYRQDPAN